MAVFFMRGLYPLRAPRKGDSFRRDRQLRGGDPALEVGPDPPVLAAAQEQGSKSIKALAGIELRSEEINETYQAVQKNLIEKEAALAAWESQHQDVALRQIRNEAELRQVIGRVVETEARVDELNRNYEIEKTAYQLSATKLNEASFSVASRAAELKILDAAIVPTQPDRTSVLLKLVMAGTIGFGSFVMVAFLLEYLKRNWRVRSREAR